LEHRLSPLPFSKTERGITRFDGGSEVEVLREEVARGSELTPAQQAFLENEDEGAWKRPRLALRGAGGKELPEKETAATARPSVYGKRLDEFAVSKFPSYRRHGVLQPTDNERVDDALLMGCPDSDASHNGADHSASHPMSADVWEKLFADDVLQLAQEILVHICGDSCYKYSGARMQHIVCEKLLPDIGTHGMTCTVVGTVVGCIAVRTAHQESIVHALIVSRLEYAVPAIAWKLRHSKLIQALSVDRWACRRRGLLLGELLATGTSQC
jgi:hypothetical protein